MAAYTNYKRAKNADTPENTARYYLTNGKLLPEVLKAKSEGKLTNELAKMLMILTRKYASKPCFANYTYREDMVSEALANLCQNALKFNAEKSSNPFAFYTTCVHNSFLQFLNVERKHRRIRDQLLIDMGENPSYNFNEEHKSQQNESGDFKSELNDLKTQIEEAHIRVKQEAEWAAIKAAELAAEALTAAEALGEVVELVRLEAEPVAIGSLLEFDDEDTTTEE